MTDKHPNRRKGRVLDAPQQSRIVWGVTALPMTVLLVAAVVLWVLTDRVFDEAQQNHVELPTLGLLAMTQFLFVALTGVVAVVQALRYSHRVIGPAYRIAQSLRRVREGDTAFQVRLREGDELQSILDELNPLIEQLERQRAGTPVTDAPAADAAAGQTASATTEADAGRPQGATSHDAD